MAGFYVQLFLVSALCLFSQTNAHYGAYSYSNFYRGPSTFYSHNALLPTQFSTHLPTQFSTQLPTQFSTQLPTLTVVEEEAYTMDDKMARVPLVLVPSNRLKVVHGAGTYLEHTYYGHQELPAIRLVLPRPVLVNHVTTMIEFPAGFTVLHEGHRVPLRVAAVLAPVFATTPGPQQVRVVYAIPAQSFSYESYHQVQQPIRRPTQPSGVVASYAPLSQSNAYLPPAAAAPQLHLQAPAPVRPATPSRPVVTILDFPSSVSSPHTLFFQPPPDPESELGYREPPQAVVPAGIVQSTAPLPNVSLFVNAKESPILQVLRDEAQRNRLSNTRYSDDNVVTAN